MLFRLPESQLGIRTCATVLDSMTMAGGRSEAIRVTGGCNYGKIHLIFNGKDPPFLMGKSTCLMGKSPFLMGKSTFLMGSSPYF